ncbi:hypothetical protein RDWZM_003066 [Blomia tropicalis]|uniref:Uncharacterized protein n=1 Tax=Blomia tropicalis TaxID=40697 RepID=A0A9Q0MEI5_BLOTA|nr:hypothetical protein RDWZM_003066 [Blomia tropicalis]
MADNSSTTRTNNENNSNTPTGINAAMMFISRKRTETFLLSIRLATLVFTALYLIPFTSFSAINLYQKALLANAAISALRLHQRLPPFRFSREYLALVFIEDSAHYLLYSMIFLSNHAITLVLLPIALFALLHSSSFLHNILNAMDSNSSIGNFITNTIGRYQREIFLTIALTEITLMPTLFFAILSGLASIFTPFMYYQFLMLRYSSQRNPYTRQAFHWLRLWFEKTANSPRCPQMGRSVIYKSIEIICRLAPQPV